MMASDAACRARLVRPGAMRTVTATKAWLSSPSAIRKCSRRAARREHFLIADGEPSHAFVAVTVRIAPGRTKRARQAASEAIMAALYDVIEPVYLSRGLALSVEVTELDASAMTRRNGLREREGETR